MTNEGQMILGLVIGVFVLIFLVIRTKVHVFPALLIGAALTGIIGGMPPLAVIDSITSGFGTTLGNIGIVIGFGVMLGRVLEVSGAAERLAFSVIKMIGKRKEEWAMALTGYIVSIPIFVDSAFVILAPVIKALSSKTGKSIVSLGIALGVGLIITHHLVPPTPGPLGVAGIFGVDIGHLLFSGLLFGIPLIFVGVFYAKWMGKRIHQLPTEDGLGWYRPEQPMTYQEFIELEENKNLPSLFLAVLPIVLPIILIFMNTGLNAMNLTGGIYDFLTFLGTPVVAVGLGLLIAIYTLFHRIKRSEALERMEEGVSSAGIILLVTGAGGALGYILRDSGTGDYIASLVASLPLPAILIPFFVASIVRLIQGSGTVAMITAASITAPILQHMDVNLILAAQAATMGAFVFSYFNDSGFHIITRLIGVKNVKEQIMVWSIPMTLIWLVSLVMLLVVNMFV